MLIGVFGAGETVSGWGLGLCGCVFQPRASNFNLCVKQLGSSLNTRVSRGLNYWARVSGHMLATTRTAMGYYD